MKIVRSLFLLFLFLVAGRGCADEQPSHTTATTALESCLEGEQLLNATAPAGFVSKTAAVVPMGRRISPVGSLVPVAYFPMAIAFSPDSSFAFVIHSGRWLLEVIDIERGEVVQTVPDVGGFRGLAIGENPLRVFTAEAARGTVSSLVFENDVLTMHRQLKLDGVPTDLELTMDGQTLLVVSAANSVIWELDAENLKIKSTYKTRGIYPYAAALSPDDSVVFVSHVGDDTVTAIDRATG